MKAASVYLSEPSANDLGRNVAALDSARLALSARGSTQRRQPGDTPVSKPPGLSVVKASERVIALGQAAHMALADFSKSTLLVGDLDLAADDERPEERIARLVWSCVNTTKIVVLGESAWQSAQLLPVADLQAFPVPPLRLRMDDESAASHGLVVIDHDDGGDALALVDHLRRHHDEVIYVGPSSPGGLFGTPRERSVSRASIHIHVGGHTIKDDQLRLVDTWESRILAIQLRPARRPYLGETGSDDLLIDDETNGFVCRTPDQVLARCDDLLTDYVLQRKFVEAGLRSVAPSSRMWSAIADELLR